ncbi:phosphodiester glycosidase family protein [Tumebacillus amylolyticus]|nr:phosphodiester glycosidase family protein [Tumebacillus amylolyticus]
MKKWLKRMAILGGLFVYLIVSSVLLVFYGPFEHLRSMVVGSILTSRHPQYAEYFLSQEKLKQYQPLAMDVAANGDAGALNNYSDITDDSIEVLPIDEKLFTGKLMIVKDPKRLHVEVTQHLNDVGELVSDMADRVNAVAAVNAGGFLDVAGHGTGGIPLGLTITHGKTIVQPTNDPIIGFNRDGALVIGKYNKEDIPSLNLVEAVSFGPQLVNKGQGMITSGDGGWGRSARSAIGQRSDGAVLLLVVQGRGTGGIGATLKDLEETMLQNGAETAANLDGGFSAEMWQDNNLIVPPSNPLGERPVATAFVVSKH